MRILFKQSPIIILFLAMFFTGNVKAQDSTFLDQTIRIATKAYFNIEDHSVRLRWVPQNYYTWKLGIERGYVVKRMRSKVNGNEVPIHEMLVTANEFHFHIADQGFFESSSNENVQVAGSAVYNPEEFQDATLSDNPLVKAQYYEDKEKNRFLFSLLAVDLSVEAAEAMGMYLKDEIELENEYIYEVTIAELNEEEQLGSKHGVAVVGTSDQDFKYFPKIPDLMTESGDSIAVLKWKLDPEKWYNSYDIYKKSEESETFIKITEEPFLANTEEGSEYITYIDKLSANKIKFEYYLVGRTCFGINGPESDKVYAVGKPSPIKGIPNITDVYEVSGKMYMHWTFPEDLISKVDHFDIIRANKKDGVYTSVASGLPKEKTEFMHDKPSPMNYYAVVAIDENGYQLSSTPVIGILEDNVPPASPKGGKAIIDKDGNTTITWQANSEEDLEGYQVFMGNHADGQYVAITEGKIKETTFYHYFNINILADKTYFKVAAYDFRENRSILSEPIEAIIPDVIPPVTPLMVSVVPVAAGIQLEWMKSSSSDVVKHELERKVATSDEWKTIQTIDVSNPIPSNFYLDNKGEVMEEYDYRITAFDDAGLTASSKIFRAKNYAGGFRPDVLNPYAFEDKQLKYYYVNNSSQLNDMATGIDGYIKLFWQYPASKDIYDFQIYRKFNNSPAILLKSVGYEDALFNGTITLPNPNIPNGSITLGNNNTKGGAGNTSTNGTTPNSGTTSNSTRLLGDHLSFLAFNNGYFEYLDKNTGSTVLIPNKYNLTKTVLDYQSSFGSYDNYVDGKTIIQVPSLKTPGLQVKVQGAITIYYDPATDETVNVTGQATNTNGTVNTGNLASPNALVGSSLSFSIIQNGYNEYIDKITNAIVRIPSTKFNLSSSTLEFKITSNGYDNYVDLGNGAIIEIPTTSAKTLTSNGTINGYKYYVDSQSSISIIIPVSTVGSSSSSGIAGSTPKSSLLGQTLAFSQIQGSYYEYLDKRAGAIYGIFAKQYPKLSQTTLVYENSANTYDNYPDAGNPTVIVTVPTALTPTLKLVSSVKGYDRYEDAATSNYILIPNSGSNSNTVGTSQTPNLANLQSFLVDDDDLNTILSLKSTSILSYQVIVRFRDGTSSKLSAPFKVN